MIQNLLAKDDVMNEWDKLIKETAHHVLSFSRFDSKDHYEMFGKRMFHKYSCIGFFAKDKTKPWTHFTSTLSQKIRHLRWRWKKTRSENGNTPEVSKRRKKAPREFLDISAVEEENEMTEEAAIQSMKDELSKPFKEQDRPLMIKALRVTFKSRRIFIQSCTADGKAYMKTIVEKYPLLKYADFIQKEFFQVKSTLSPEKLEENWVEMLGKLDKVFENVEAEDKELGDEQEEILRLIKQVLEATYFKATKKDVPLITEVQVTKPSIVKTTTPCVVIVRNEDSKLNTTYISHEGVSIDIGKNIKKSIEVLIMLFFVLDLSYPKCHQLLITIVMNSSIV